MTNVIVNKEQLAESLALVRARTADPVAGIHGPGSAAWDLQREGIVFIGGLRAALLQMAHPYVAYGIDQHSKTRTDVQGRFQRTFINVFAMVYGDLDTALRSAEVVHMVHTRINGKIDEDVGAFKRGHVYHANDSGSLMWVYATLMHTVLEVHDLALRPLSMAVKERYYQDSKSFALLFGIPMSELPVDYPAFERYVQDMMASPTLTVSTPALEMSKFLMTPPRPALAPLMNWIKRITALMLPERLRQQYELPLTRRDRFMAKASLRAIRPLYLATPRRLRYLPAYVDAQRRLAGRGPSRFGGWFESLVKFGIGNPEAG